MQAARPLLRILGLGFGLALVAVALLSACVPAYSWMARRRLRRVALAAA